VYKQLVEFLQENKMLYHLQSGFRQKYSTDTCLIYLLNYLRTNNAKAYFMLWGTTPVVIDWLIIDVIGTFITLAPSFINRAEISSKPVLLLALREHNALKTNSSVTSCKASFLLWGFLL
jgi:hypothetical protein